MAKKGMTVKQLEKLICKWDEYIPKCISYRDNLIDYKNKLTSGTTPPGNPPPTPPGVPGKG